MKRFLPKKDAKRRKHIGNVEAGFPSKSSKHERNTWYNKRKHWVLFAFCQFLAWCIWNLSSLSICRCHSVPLSRHVCASFLCFKFCFMFSCAFGGYLSSGSKILGVRRSYGAFDLLGNGKRILWWAFRPDQWRNMPAWPIFLKSSSWDIFAYRGHGFTMFHLQAFIEHVFRSAIEAFWGPRAGLRIFPGNHYSHERWLHHSAAKFPGRSVCGSFIVVYFCSQHVYSLYIEGHPMPVTASGRFPFWNKIWRSTRKSGFFVASFLNSEKKVGNSVA